MKKAAEISAAFRCSRELRVRPWRSPAIAVPAIVARAVSIGAPITVAAVISRPIMGAPVSAVIGRRGIAIAVIRRPVAVAAIIRRRVAAVVAAIRSAAVVAIAWAIRIRAGGDAA